MVGGPNRIRCAVTFAEQQAADDRSSVERGLEAYLRAKFVVPCSAMIGLVDLMAEENPEATLGALQAFLRT